MVVVPSWYEGLAWSWLVGAGFALTAVIVVAEPANSTATSRALSIHLVVGEFFVLMLFPFPLQ